MTHTEEERKSERRHETAIAGVTAWAGEWRSHRIGGRHYCWIEWNGVHACDIRVIADRDGLVEIEAPYDEMSPAAALVLAKVLQEAATLAQGGEVAS